jgi:hypothetical protein
MGNAFELVQIQPFMPCGSIEALDVGILSGLAGLNVDQRYPVSVGPVYQ